MTTLTTVLKSSIAFNLSQALDFASRAYPHPAADGVTLANGTGNSQADLAFADQRALAASTSEELDLAGGSLSDPLGNALTFVKVKAIRIKAAATNGGNIVVGGASSNAFVGPFADASDKLEIPAGGQVQLQAPVAGWAVTAGTGDLLQIENDDSGAAASYDIEIVGTSA